MVGEDEMDLPRTPDSPSIARGILADVLQGLPYEKAEIAVSELVTNALRHTDGAIALRYRAREGCVRVEVLDESGAPPRLRQPGPGDIGGRGLVIVDDVSDRWGSGPRPDGRSGKAVWFEVDASTSSSEAHTAHARVRSAEFWRALDRLVALPAPLEIRVGIEPGHVVMTEHDGDHGWWSTVAVPRTDPAAPTSPTASVTVPRMEAREMVGLQTLDARDAPDCRVEVTNGVALRLDANTVAASPSAASIPMPPVLDHDAAVDHVPIVPEAGRPDLCVLAVGEAGGHGTVELSGRAVERFEARHIRRGVLVEAEREFFLAGATDDPAPEQIFLVARVQRVDPPGAEA